MNKIIAEIGSVHDGNLRLAYKLIKKAASCGADIIKFQMHIPDYETLKNAPSPVAAAPIPTPAFIIPGPNTVANAANAPTTGNLFSIELKPTPTPCFFIT